MPGKQSNESTSNKHYNGVIAQIHINELVETIKLCNKNINLINKKKQINL